MSKDRNFSEEVVNATQEVSDLNVVKQVVDIDMSDLKNLSAEEGRAIAGNVSLKIQLKHDSENSGKEIYEKANNYNGIGTSSIERMG